MARVSEAEVRAEFDIIEGLIARHPEGISRTSLEQVFSESKGRRIAKRTILRRLERLIREERVRSEGCVSALLHS